MTVWLLIFLKSFELGKLIATSDLSLAQQHNGFNSNDVYLKVLERWRGGAGAGKRAGKSDSNANAAWPPRADARAPRHPLKPSSNVIPL